MTRWGRGNNSGGEAEGGEQGQVRDLLIKVEAIQQEDVHVYRRLEEERSRRQQQLRAPPGTETNVGGVRRKQKTAEARINMEQEAEEM